MVAKGKVSMANGTDHGDKGRLRLTVLSSVASRAGIWFATFDAASSREHKSRNKGSQKAVSGFQLSDEQCIQCAWSLLLGTALFKSVQEENYIY